MSDTSFRWQRADDADPALFGIDDLLLPDLGTGRMSDLEFLHVKAKRILNHVPTNSRAPSNWTINVYRGCSHACAYCLAGDTPVLMADGRIKVIADVRPGDKVYGTVRRGSYRRYVPTEVLDHWATVKRAWRITLEDGTQLVASGDHRFLTDRGWKYVSPADRPTQRPFLTTNNELLGVGSVGSPPAHCDAYRRGYLTGMIRGDAHLGTYHYRFAEVTERRRAITAIRTSAKPAVDRIRDIVRWPNRPSEQWQRGFLAGIFDAEGSYSCGVLRIANKDADILAWTMSSASALGIPMVLEPPRNNGVRTARVAGGLVEQLKFLVRTDPVTTRKRVIDDTAIKSNARLRVTSVVPLDIEMPMYDITTGTGDFVANGVISHNCFARPTHEYLGFNIGADFDRKIVVKINAVEKLRAELADPRWRGETIAMGTNTDPYQRAEAKYRLTRGVLEVLAEHGNPFSILTKSPLVTRDLDVISRAAQRADVSVNFSIGTLDERVWRLTEPGAPHPQRRLDALAAFAAAGVRTGALVAPVLPGLSDQADQLRDVVRGIADAGGRLLGIGPLHLRAGLREHFLAWLAEVDPQLHADYLRRYADRAHAPQRYLDMLYERAGLPRASRPSRKDRR